MRDIHRCMQSLLMQVFQQSSVTFGITAVELRHCTVRDPACMLCSSCLWLEALLCEGRVEPTAGTYAITIHLPKHSTCTGQPF